MTEADLTQNLLRAMRGVMRGAMAEKISDRFNGGRPDVLLTWAKVSSWWEAKFYNEGPFDSPDLQEIECKRLAIQGHCHYVIYERRQGREQTRIVRPAEISRWDKAGHVFPGFDHDGVALFARDLHMSVWKSKSKT